MMWEQSRRRCGFTPATLGLTGMFLLRNWSSSERIGSEQWKRGWETVEEDSQGCLSDPLIKQPEFSDSFHLNRTLKSVFCD